ncbi:hypothetical protein K469DRAFT_593291, partial [Zopfia rhizophila CBS 207.26]
APSSCLSYIITKNKSNYSNLLTSVKVNNILNYYTFTNLTKGIYINYYYFNAYNIMSCFKFSFSFIYTTFKYTNFNIIIINLGINVTILLLFVFIS